MTAATLLARFQTGLDVPGRHVVVTAHPDDETISFGGALCHVARVVVVQLTTGATAAQNAERQTARAAAGWAYDVIECGVPGSESAHHLALLLACVDAALENADVVWSHPYEGGHPDHDTAAWLVQTACAGRVAEPLRMEFASYHRIDARHDRFGQFWPDATTPAVACRLTGKTLRRKRAAIAAYDSQAAILRKFPDPAVEWYRAAPTYDFARPAPPPVCRWDAKGYLPTSQAWRQAVRRMSPILKVAS